MAEKIKKVFRHCSRQGFFKVLPWSVVIFLVIALSIGFLNSLPKVQPAEAADTINSSVYIDNNGDGRVDRIRWTMDENVTACTYEAEDWTVNNAGSINVSITGLNCTGTDAILDILVSADAGETGGATNPVISYDNDDADNSVTLTSGPMTNKLNVTANDAAAPIVVARETADADSNGKIDRIIFTTTENLDDDASGLTIDVSGYVGETFNTGSVANDNIFWIDFTENAGSCSVGDQSGCDTNAEPDTQITANTSLSDLVGNDIAVDGAPVNTTVDRAPPVFLAAGYMNLGVEPSNPNTVSGGDSDLGLSITQFLANCKVTTGISNNQWDSGEDVYIDNDLNGFVSDGDVRVTNVYQIYDVGSTVSCPGDGDCGTSIENLTQCKVTGSDNTWSPGKEYIYDDIDTSGTVTVGDGRLYYPETPNNVVDLLIVLFSEDVTYSYLDSEWTAVDNDLTGFDVSGCAFGGLGCAAAFSKFLVLDVSGTPVNQTGVVGFGGTEPTIAYTYSANYIQDWRGNNSADIPATSVLDAARPVMISADYYDLDYNGTVDTIRTTWSEYVTMSGSTSDDWSIEGGDINATFSSAPDDGSAGFTLDISVTADANKTGADVAPTISYNNGDNNDSVIDTTLSNAAEATPPGSPVIVGDKAAPVMVDVDQVYYQSGSDSATVDRFNLMWSEKITYNGFDLNQFNIDNHDLTNFDSDGTPDALVGGGLGTGNYLAFSTSGTTNLTGVSGGTEPDVTYTESFTAANRVKDLVGNDAVSPQGPLTIEDSAEPVLLSAVYLDTDSNGQVETIRTTWSENVVMSGSTADDWTIVGGDINAIFSSAPDDLVPGTTLDILVTADANETGSSVLVTIAYDNDDLNHSVTDSTGVYINQASTTGPRTATDGAAPIVISRQTDDSDGNGHIDRIIMTTTENLDDDGSGLTVDVAGYAGEAFITLVLGDNIFAITFTESGTYDTGNTPTVQITANTTLSDSLGNNIPVDAVPVVSTDGAAPVITVRGYSQSVTTSATVDRMSLKWSEQVNYNGLDLTQFSIVNNDLTNFDSNGTPDSLVSGSGTSTLLFSTSGTTNLTGVSGGIEPTITYTESATAANRVKDLSGNDAISPQGPLTLGDSAAPVIVSATYLDSDNDGSVETIRTIWSENVVMSGSTADDWTIVGGDINAVFSSAPDDTTPGTTLDVIVTADANKTGSSTAVTITYDNDDSNGSVQDTVWLVAGTTGPVTAIDGAAPVLRTDGANAPTYLDNDGNGTIDRVRLVFTENTYVTYLDTDWTVTANTLTGFDVTGLNSGSGTTTIILNATASANITGVGTAGTKPTLAYTNVGNRINDGTNNTATWAATNVEDGAAPVVVSTTPANGTVGVSVNQALVWNFSEPMVTTFGTPLQFTSTNDPGGWSAVWSNANKTVTMTHAPYPYAVIVNITTNEANINADSGNPTLLNVAGLPPVPDDWTFATRTASGGGGGGGGGYVPTAISLTSPNGGETWAGNSSQNITWIYSGSAINKVKLFYSLDRGATFPYEIARDEANDGIYSWTVANVPSNTVKIKIEGYDSAGNFLVSDISDADFTITYTAPTVSADNSTVIASPISVVADGASQSTITVTVKDATGALVSGKTVTLASSRGAQDTITTVTGTTGTDGKATFKVSSNTVGTSTYTATVNGVVLTQTASVVFTSPGAPSEVPPAEFPVGLKVGDLIKTEISSTVYYLGSDGKRHAFPNALTYRTWYLDWSGIKVIPLSQLQGIPLGKNVTVRAGTVLVKIQTDPKVYAVEPNGLLRWIPTEERARTLYGPEWTKRVVDVPLAFWGDYTFGADIATDIYPTGALIKYAGTTEIYYIQGAEKRWIATEAAFIANNFRWMNVLTAPATIYYPTGAPITSKELPLAAIY